MPQIAQIVETYASQIFWLLIVFGLIYFGIGRAMLPRIEATVGARDGKIAGDLAAAEAARTSADASEEAYRTRLNAAREQAQAATATAKAGATRDAEARVKAADAEVATRSAEAEARLFAARDAALGQIDDAAIDAAQEIVARISGQNVDRDAAARAVRAAAH